MARSRDQDRAEGGSTAKPPVMRPVMRVDKWLWEVRFFKTRALAADLVSGAHLRINGQKVGKPAHGVGPGDTLTFAQGGRVWLIRVVDMPIRRGPPAEAQTLYLDLDAPAVPAASAAPSPLE